MHFNIVLVFSLKVVVLNIQFMDIADFQLLSLVGLFEKYKVLLSKLTKKLSATTYFCPKFQATVAGFL